MSDLDISIEKEVRALKLIDSLAALLKDDESLQSRVAEAMEYSASGTQLRSVTLKRRNTQPYYTEANALMLKPYLDQMIERDCKVPIEFPRSSYPTLTPRTIYLRIYQGFQWLRDNHPEKKTYADLYARVEITQSHKTGVRIVQKSNALTPLVARDIDTTFEHLRSLQDGIIEALKQPQAVPVAVVFEKYKLSLSDEDQDKIKDMLAGIEGLTVSIKETEVVIMRRIQ